MDGILSGTFLVPFLALITFLLVLIFAMRSQQKVLERMRDPNAPKSTLAADAPSRTPDHKGVD